MRAYVLSGCHYEGDWRPSMTDVAAELYTVHTPWHVHIRKNKANIGSLLQNSDRLICIRTIKNGKSCV